MLIHVQLHGTFYFLKTQFLIRFGTKYVSKHLLVNLSTWDTFHFMLYCFQIYNNGPKDDWPELWEAYWLFNCKMQNSCSLMVELIDKTAYSYFHATGMQNGKFLRTKVINNRENVWWSHVFNQFKCTTLHAGLCLLAQNGLEIPVMSISSSVDLNVIILKWSLELKKMWVILISQLEHHQRRYWFFLKCRV